MPKSIRIDFKNSCTVIVLALLVTSIYAGSITGMVSLPSKIQRPVKASKSAGYGNAVKPMAPMEMNEMENIVVYIEKTPDKKTYPVPAGKVVMDQKNLTFEPHVLPVLVGTSVDFLNSDDFYHSVFSFSGAKYFDLGKYPKGVSKPVVFNKVGTVNVYCEIHSFMQSFILVLQNPYFTKPDDKGSFKLDNIPAGKYNLVAWHDFLKVENKPVEVPADGNIEVNFDMKRK